MVLRQYALQNGDIFTFTYYKKYFNYIKFRKLKTGKRYKFAYGCFYEDINGDFIIIQKLYFFPKWIFWKFKKYIKFIYKPLDKSMIL